jgi:ADP-ribosyl-[dinitrogen reductase] hydrolase
LGLAVGDALNSVIDEEFQDPMEEVVVPITDFRPGPDFSEGAWTDDTSLALCTVSSLLRKKGFDLKDQLECLVSWYTGGHHTCEGKVVKVKTTTKKALDRYLQDREALWGIEEADAVDSDVLLRTFPVAMFFVEEPHIGLSKAAKAARLTHGLKVCIDACRYFSGLVTGAILGVKKEKLLSPAWRPFNGPWSAEELHPDIWPIAIGSFKDKEPPDIKATTHIADALEAALWAFHKSIDYEDAVLKAINLGGDADTVAAVCGVLAGAYYGYKNIPERWKDKLKKKDEILSLTSDFYRLALGR